MSKQILTNIYLSFIRRTDFMKSDGPFNLTILWESQNGRLIGLNREKYLGVSNPLAFVICD